MEDTGGNLKKVRRLLEHFARAHNLDLEQLTRDAQTLAAEVVTQEDLNDHPLMHAAMAYCHACGAYLKAAGADYNESCDDADGRAEMMNIEEEDRRLEGIRAQLEVLAWDHTLVTAKVRRALDAKLESLEEADSDMRDASVSDAAGSAFVARNSLIRSKAALTRLYEWDSQRQDRIIDLLVMAERLQRNLEALVPECMDFQWPPREEE